RACNAAWAHHKFTFVVILSEAKRNEGSRPGKRLSLSRDSSLSTAQPRMTIVQERQYLLERRDVIADELLERARAAPGDIADDAPHLVECPLLPPHQEFVGRIRQPGGQASLNHRLLGLLE